MASHGIDVFDFAYWEGPPPVVPQEHVIATHRPGADDVALVLIGTWGDMFEVVLTSHHSTLLNAAAQYNMMRNVVGTGWLFVKYANLNYTGLYSTGYHAMRCDQVDLRAAALLVGPGYSYTNGAMMRTRWLLQPEKL